MPDVPSLVLFDLDGVLVDYDRQARVRHLARVLQREPDAVWRSLFDSGLESSFDAGVIDTSVYLDTLGKALGCRVAVDTWAAARGHAMHLHAATVHLVHAVARQRAVAVLTNNGRLLVDVLPGLAPSLFPLFDGRVLCSGALGHRKPDVAAYLAAFGRLGHAPGTTLFLDDVEANVEGARQAGMEARHVASPAHLASVLRRCGLP